MSLVVAKDLKSSSLTSRWYPKSYAKQIAYFWDLVKNIINYIHEFFYVASSYMFLFHKECDFFPPFKKKKNNLLWGRSFGDHPQAGGLLPPNLATGPRSKVEKSLGIAGN
jgi:hypothetical protein